MWVVLRLGGPPHHHLAPPWRWGGPPHRACLHGAALMTENSSRDPSFPLHPGTLHSPSSPAGGGRRGPAPSDHHARRLTIERVWWRCIPFGYAPGLAITRVWWRRISFGDGDSILSLDALLHRRLADTCRGWSQLLCGQYVCWQRGGAPCACFQRFVDGVRGL